jgi:hypothetical protein
MTFPLTVVNNFDSQLVTLLRKSAYLAPSLLGSATPSVLELQARRFTLFEKRVSSFRSETRISASSNFHGTEQKNLS